MDAATIEALISRAIARGVEMVGGTVGAAASGGGAAAEKREETVRSGPHVFWADRLERVALQVRSRHERVRTGLGRASGEGAGPGRGRVGDRR